MQNNNCLEAEYSAGSLKLYRIKRNAAGVEPYIATTPQSRAICNDPRVCGVNYTKLLRHTCTNVLKAFPGLMTEHEAVVVNILRGGLNFGLRDALAEAFGWNTHTTCFMSAQRARDASSPDAWHITENDYKKVYFPPVASFAVGDVVATGTSLRYGLNELLAAAHTQRTDVRNLIFFTYGGIKAEEILAELDSRCRKEFPHYGRTLLIYLEGCFTVAQADTPLSVRLTGTDLLRYNALMAPEFIESQYEDPAYPIERCVIYDAGSRAFWMHDYIEDVIGYWKENLQFAERGITFRELALERFPGLDLERFGDVDLKALALRQISRMEKLAKGNDYEKLRQ